MKLSCGETAKRLLRHALGPALLVGIAAATSAQAQGNSVGRWGQAYPDQWGLERLGLAAEGALRQAAADSETAVAIVGSGIDYTHAGLGPESLWRNPRERDNGLDDDANGYVDDLIGWDFVAAGKRPWDRSGHGTLLAGIVAARATAAQGVAGANPHARLMALRVLNSAGRARRSSTALAIDYAADQGAGVVLLAVPADVLGELEQRAIRRAVSRGVVVVIPGGDRASPVPARLVRLPGVLVVAATTPDDERAVFSNFGPEIAVAAPGYDILSLRARGSDFQRTSGAANYAAGSAVVADEYYRSSGSAMAAAFVAGSVSLLRAARPELDARQLARVVTQTARDIGAPGVDAYTGYGLIDPGAALEADPERYVIARIASVRVERREERSWIPIQGSVDADRFKTAELQLAIRGDDDAAEPEKWQTVATYAEPIRAGQLAELEPSVFEESQRWWLRLWAESEDGRRREARYALELE